MLQFTSPEKRQQRKALLTPAVNTDEEADEASSDMPPGLAVAPRPIQGDLRERMMLDPEVRQRVRIIKISAVVITSVLVIVVLGSVFHWWAGIGDALSGMVKKYSAGRVVAVDDSSVLEVKPEKTSGSVEKDPGPVTPTPPSTLPPPPPFKVEQPEQDDAGILKVVTAFLQAPTVDQRLDLVLSRTIVEPKAREFYKRHPDGPVPYESVESLGRDSAINTAYVFAVIMKDGEHRRLMVRKSIKKGYLVDWSSFVIYSEMEWGDFLSSRPQTPVLFRIMAGVSDVYRNDFLDPKKFLCLKISNPLNVQTPPLYAYAQRSSSLGHTLEFIMQRASGTSIPLMLKLKFPETAGASDQVWVDEFVGEGWVARIW